MGAWSLGIWSMGVWGVLGMGACVSHADICQGMHMANSVYVPQALDLLSSHALEQVNKSS